MLEVFDERVCAVGEAPWYEPGSGRVGWVDVPAGRVLWRAFDGTAAGEAAVPAPVGAAVPRRGGGSVLCLADGPVLADPDGARHPLGTFAGADVRDGGGPAGWAVRANDAKADPVGRLFVGTLPLDVGASGGLYRLDPGTRALRRLLAGVGVANGLGWSPDGATFYFTDTAAGRVDAFDYALASGELSRRRPFVDFAGLRTRPDMGEVGKPDGLCVDAAGGVWVACWGGGRVLRFTAAGVPDRDVPVPTPLVASCAFAGPGLDTLVVTTAAIRESAGRPGAGLTYRYRPGDVTGQPVGGYAG